MEDIKEPHLGWKTIFGISPSCIKLFHVPSSNSVKFLEDRKNSMVAPSFEPRSIFRMVIDLVIYLVIIGLVYGEYVDDIWWIYGWCMVTSLVGALEHVWFFPYWECLGIPSSQLTFVIFFRGLNRQPALMLRGVFFDKMCLRSRFLYYPVVRRER